MRLLWVAPLFASLLVGCGDSKPPVDATVPRPGATSNEPATTSSPPAGPLAVLPWKVTISPQTAGPGGTLAIKGRGFKPNRKCQVTVLYPQQPASKKQACFQEPPAEVQTDADGAFEVRGTLLTLEDPAFREDGTLELWIEVLDIEMDTGTTARAPFRYQP